MSGLLKWIGMIILVICIGIWVITIAKSCKQINDPLLENTIPDNLGSSVEEGLSDAKANLDDLYDKGAEEMSDLKKEAIEAKDKIAMKAEDMSSKVFEKDPEDVNEESEMESERKAIAARQNEFTEKGSSSSDNSRSNRGNSAGSSSSSGKYFVVTGSFLLESNAKDMVNQLKKAGYPNAEVAVFDLSQYYTVFARRYNTLNSANNLAETISGKLGIETYVHEKRAHYKNR